MKVAEARYTGSMRTHHRKGPSGSDYNFHSYEEDELEWVVIESPEDARWLDRQPGIEVEWTPMGRLKAASDDVYSAIESLGYQAKQRLVGEEGFDLDVAGNAKESEMEEELKKHVEELDKAGEL